MAWRIWLVALVAAWAMATAAAAVNKSASPAPKTSSGSPTTIGTAETPQVVRVGPSLREVNPADPSALLPGAFRFTGVDAYELNTWWGINEGCGSMESTADLDALFRSLGPHAVVRAWFFQQFAVNVSTHTIDWTALDRTVDTANQYGVHLIATLGNQDGTCDDNVWKSAAWYDSGYENSEPGWPDSYAHWVAAVASRYRANPAILAWEPINEPRADTCNTASAKSGPNCWSYRSCPSKSAATHALRSFFDKIGAEVRADDPNALISDGAPPIDGCGTQSYADWAHVEASPGIDLMSFHDYSGTAPLSTGAQVQFLYASTTLKKPYFAGENGGVNTSGAGGLSSPCPSGAARAGAYQTKINQEFAFSSAFVGWLFWNWGPGDPTTAASRCTYATWPGESMMPMLAQTNSALG